MMVITIDGPAGAGKSTIARALAERLGFEFLDTGAMYRAVALAGVRAEADFDDLDAVADLASRRSIELDGARTFLDGEDVTTEIRRPAVTSKVHFAADNPRVRRQLVELQRLCADQRDIVTEGRDQGTVVFPDARCKVFLTATAEERARRRARELESRGESADFDEILRQQNDRDYRDANRAVGRLVAAQDAVTVYTDGLTIEQVVDRLEEIVRQRIPIA